MAEVGYACRRTAYTLLKKSSNFLFSRSTEKTAKSTFAAVIVSNGIREHGLQQKDVLAPVLNCEPGMFFQGCADKPPVRETKLPGALPKQMNGLIFIFQVEGLLYPFCLNFLDSVEFLLDDTGLSGENRLLKMSGLQTEEHIGPGNAHQSTSEEMRKYPGGSDGVCSMLASPCTLVCSRSSRTTSVWKRNSFLIASILAVSQRTCDPPKRSFYTVLLTEKEGSCCRFSQRPPLSSQIRSYTRNGSPEMPLYQSKTAYYDILQVDSSATHAQIKTAYYKQSFIFHPDRNAGSEEATKRFSEITEAYNVLGNKSLKKKYDRGILSKADVQGAGRPSAKEAPSSSTVSQSKRSKHSPVVGEGGKSAFDFDAFYKAHYGEQLQREKDLRQRRKEVKKKLDDPNQGLFTEVTVGLLLVMAAAVLFSINI